MSAAPSSARGLALGRLTARHGRAVLVLVTLLAAAGTISLFSLPGSIYPPLQFPRIVVVAEGGTLPSRTMVLSVARPLEEALMAVPGVRRVRSKSFRGATEISAQFTPSTDMVVALQQAQNRVEEARTGLPDEIELTIERLTPDAFPILSLDLGGGLSIPELADYARYVIRPALSRVPGVGRVTMLASDTREIEVAVDPAKLLAAGLTVADVAQALAAANRLTPAGRYTEAGQQRLVLASGLFASAADVAAAPVAVRGSATVRVGDVAEVFPGAPDRTMLATGNGRDTAIVNVSQQLGANIREVRRGVDAALRELVRTLPSGLRISKVYDLGDFVEQAIGSVRDAILFGGALAVLVLVGFLRDWRMTVIASLTLPLTILSTFFFLKLFHGSINLMSMGGLAVAIGLVIDDAVVVVENIHRRMASAPGPLVVDEATAELVAPVVGSTITTVVVFVPLGLLSGVAGQFFQALSLTLAIAVLLSLLLALTLIPLLSRYVYRKRIRGATDATAGEPERRVPRLERVYAAALGKVAPRPRVVWAGVAALALATVLLAFAVPSGFLPQMDEGGFVIDYLTPAGSALEESDRLIRKVEELVAATPEVAAFSRRTGSELGLFATQANDGDVLVRLKPRSQRSRSSAEVVDGLRPKLAAAVPGVELEFAQLLQDMIGDLEGAPTPVEVKVFGDDSAELARLAGEVESLLAEVDGVVDVVGPQRGNPEVTWQIDPVAAGRLGLTVDDVAAQIRAGWLGEVATELRLFDRTVPVRVRYADAARSDPAQLATTLVRSGDGRAVPLSSLGRPVYENGQSELTRENLREMALVTARLEDRDLGSAVREIRRRLRELALPVGYTLEVGGQYESQRQAFGELLLVLGVAVALVFLVLVIQFRSFTAALVVAAAAPLSFGGAFALLWATGTELNVSSAMGLILLVGLVVKNGIVMLDYAHRLRDEGLPPREAVSRAARVRLRPILMTTLCTLFGLLPLALGIGSGAELHKPLAVAVIGGLGLSTLVTLFVVPSVYSAVAAEGGKNEPQTGL